jgi:hypothetical protein
MSGGIDTGSKGGGALLPPLRESSDEALGSLRPHGETVRPPQIATVPEAGSVAGLDRAGAKTVAPSRRLPQTGKVLGVADHVGIRRPVAIAAEDARHHLHVVGETGTGKSTLLANLVVKDAAAGRAAVMIDPKGNLVESILDRLPEGCEERTCVVDLARWLARHHEELFEEELKGLYTDPALWPRDRSLEMLWNGVRSNFTPSWWIPASLRSKATLESESRPVTQLSGSEFSTATRSSPRSGGESRAPEEGGDRGGRETDAKAEERALDPAVPPPRVLSG